MTYLMIFICAYCAAYLHSVTREAIAFIDVGASDYTRIGTLLTLAVVIIAYGQVRLLRRFLPRTQTVLAYLSLVGALCWVVGLLVNYEPITHACYLTALSRHFIPEALSDGRIWLLALLTLAIPTYLWAVAIFHHVSKPVSDRPRALSWHILLIATCLGVITTRYTHTPQMKLSTQPAFGLFAKRDMLFSGSKSWTQAYENGHLVTRYQDASLGEVTLHDGRIISADKAFCATRVASAMLPFILRPQGTRFAFRGPDAVAFTPYAQAFIQDIPSGELAQGELTGLYDALFIATPPAWQDKAIGFSTTRFAKSCAKYIKPDGLLITHYDTRAMNATMLMTRIAQLKQALPFVQIWTTSPNDWLLVASRQPLLVSMDQMLEVPQRARTTQIMRTVGLDTLPELLGAYLCDASAPLKQLSVDLPDSLSNQEWKTARTLLFEPSLGVRLVKDFEPFRESKMTWIIHNPDPDLAEPFKAVLSSIQFGRAQAASANVMLYTKSVQKALTAASQARKYSPRDLYLLDWAERLRIEAESFTTIAEHKLALANYQAIFALSSPTTPDLYLNAGRSAQIQGQQTLASRYYLAAEKIVPHNVAVLFRVGQALEEETRFADALKRYDTIYTLAKDPATKQASTFSKAKVLAIPEAETFNPALAEQLLVHLCNTSNWRNKAFAFALADLYINTQRAEKGIAIKRRFQ